MYFRTAFGNLNTASGVLCIARDEKTGSSDSTCCLGKIRNDPFVNAFHYFPCVDWKGQNAQF